MPSEKDYFEAFTWAKQLCDEQLTLYGNELEKLPPHKQVNTNAHYRLLRRNFNLYKRRQETFKEFIKAYGPKAR